MIVTFLNLSVKGMLRHQFIDCSDKYEEIISEKSVLLWTGSNVGFLFPTLVYLLICVSASLYAHYSLVFGIITGVKLIFNLK